MKTTLISVNAVIQCRLSIANIASFITEVEIDFIRQFSSSKLIINIQRNNII